MVDFVPPQFDLFEFDHGRDGLGSQRRWFVHWDGLVGQPAEEVILGWARDATVVLVCTSGRVYDDHDARYRAVHVALGGTALPVAHRPPEAADTVAQIERLSRDEASWQTNSDTGSHVLLAVDFTASYQQLAQGTVFAAAVELPTDRLHLRPVTDWNSYNVNPTTRFPLSALRLD